MSKKFLPIAGWLLSILAIIAVISALYMMSLPSPGLTAKGMIGPVMLALIPVSGAIFAVAVNPLVISMWRPEWRAKVTSSITIFSFCLLGFAFTGAEALPTSVAANLGVPSAMAAMGIECWQGDGRQEDDAKAFYWIKRAAGAEADVAKNALAGSQIAQSILGRMYLEGIGTPKNSAEGIKWLTIAANRNAPKAQAELGALYHEGTIVEHDDEKALSYSLRAADAGEANAQYNVGLLYENGYGTQQNYIKARQYYEASAKQNYALAQSNLGNLLFNGLGVARDEKRAVQLFQAAAKAGLPVAQNNLGVMYEHGYGGLTADLAKANEWYALARKNGYQP